MTQPASAMKFPPQIFRLAPDTETVQSTIDQLQPLGLQWQVERDPERSRVRALAPLFIDQSTGEIWAVAAVEKAGTTHQATTPGFWAGIYHQPRGSTARPIEGDPDTR